VNSTASGGSTGPAHDTSTGGWSRRVGGSTTSRDGGGWRP
jgi:hypothetical protein